MKTVVITGATSGIGFAAAKSLAAQGARVIGVGHTQTNCDAAKAAIEAAVPDAKIMYISGDLSQRCDVNDVADAVIAQMDENGLDALINNVGAVRNWYTPTPEGYELQFALNHLAGFLLAHRLWGFLKKAGGRVIFTGSNSHKKMRMHWSDVMFKEHYNCLLAYKQSKLCNMLFAAELNRRQSEVRAYVVDPGLVNTNIGNKQTGGVVSAFWKWRKKFGVSPDVVAQTYVYLSNQLPPPDGLYFHDCRACRYSKQADDVSDAKRLFQMSEQLCGVSFGESETKRQDEDRE